MLSLLEIAIPPWLKYNFYDSFQKMTNEFFRFKRFPVGSWTVQVAYYLYILVFLG